MSSHQQDVHATITSARTSRSADIRRRQVRYLVSMGIRTVCFVLAVVTHGSMRWVFVGAALVLPYIAVVIANASEQRREVVAEPFIAEPRTGIEAQQHGRDDPAGARDGVTPE